MNPSSLFPTPLATQTPANSNPTSTKHNDQKKKPPPLETRLGCSFSTNDNLPSHLETRFRKLKSFPTTTTTTTSHFPLSKSRLLRSRSDDDLKLDERHSGLCDSIDFERIPDGKKGLESPPSTEIPEEQSDGNRDERKGLESKSNLKLNTNPHTEVCKQMDSK
ncbi:hypothetical protein L6452_37558 [Arctium lappa]|uniref:Uncharacterized protein n=1 Tax=Arctium lappa TaxID=4217 RepID=A0ACB8Y3Z1_ARCLA|nr:hypothetical protein L6452_37558 [Arctium lappa]